MERPVKNTVVSKRVLAKPSLCRELLCSRIELKLSCLPSRGFPDKSSSTSGLFCNSSHCSTRIRLSAKDKERSGGYANYDTWYTYTGPGSVILVTNIGQGMGKPPKQIRTKMSKGDETERIEVDYS